MLLLTEDKDGALFSFKGAAVIFLSISEFEITGCDVLKSVVSHNYSWDCLFRHIPSMSTLVMAISEMITIAMHIRIMYHSEEKCKCNQLCLFVHLNNRYKWPVYLLIALWACKIYLLHANMNRGVHFYDDWCYFDSVCWLKVAKLQINAFIVTFLYVFFPLKRSCKQTKHFNIAI